jgi:hypothetical protein
MRYITHNDINISSDSTHYQGKVDVSYGLLCILFGQPFSGDAYKVDAEWVIEFEDGTIATIYNYKNGINYLGVDGTPTTQISSWHIGGFVVRAAELIHQLVEDRNRVAAIQGHVLLDEEVHDVN